MHLRVGNHLICPQLNTLGAQLKTEHPGSPAQVPAQWLIRPSWDCSWGAFIKGGDFSEPSFLKNNLFCGDIWNNPASRCDNNKVKTLAI